jgi:excisionase family DNA binding protein
MKELDRDWSHARRNHQDDDEWINGSRGTSSPTRAIGSSTDALGQPLLVTVEEAARLLGIGRTTMFELIGSGEVKSIRLGRRRLIARRSLEHFVDENSFSYR